MSSQLTCVSVSAACDDDCTGVLLDDLDLLEKHFLSVNLSSATMAAYHQLVLLENRTIDLQVSRSDAALCWQGVLPSGDTSSCCVCVQVAWTGNASVATRLVRVEEELSQLTSDLGAVLQQVSFTCTWIFLPKSVTHSALRQSCGGRLKKVMISRVLIGQVARLSAQLENLGESSVSQGSQLLQNISVLHNNIQSKQQQQHQ